MAAAPTTIPTPAMAWSETLPRKGRVGILSLILTESVFFSIFVVAYVFYLGKSLAGPYPKDVLSTSDSEHHLPALEQHHDRPRDPVVAGRRYPSVYRLVVRHLRARRRVHDRHGDGMASSSSITTA